MSKKHSDNTTMLGIPENPMDDTENMNIPLLLYISIEVYKSTIYPSAKVDHHGFTLYAMSFLTTLLGRAYMKTL